MLAISEIDEKYMRMFNFRNRDGLLHLLQGQNVEKLRLSLSVQALQKHYLIAAVRQLDGSLNVIRSSLRDDSLVKASSSCIDQDAVLARDERVSSLLGNFIFLLLAVAVLDISFIENFSKFFEPFQRSSKTIDCCKLCFLDFGFDLFDILWQIFRVLQCSGLW